MSDTQWPRYEVFQQERPDRPHLNAGSVHAPDAEMALLNARDVFVRRPECISLWVVPAEDITVLTAEALAAGRWPVLPEPAQGRREPYLLFTKRQARDTYAYTGEIQADSPLEALRLAVEGTREPAVLAYWVCPKRSISSSAAEEAASMFAPARDKPYRDQAFYQPDSILREIQRQSDQEADMA